MATTVRPGDIVFHWSWIGDRELFDRMFLVLECEVEKSIFNTDVLYFVMRLLHVASMRVHEVTWLRASVMHLRDL